MDEKFEVIGILSDMTAKDLLELIEQHMAATGLKAAEVSRRASGHPYLIYKLRKGVTPSFDTVARLCESLGLEVSVGPPKGGDVRAPVSLGAPAPMTIDQGLYEPGEEREAVHGIEGLEASGRAWDEVYEDVRILQESLEGTLAAITDPRAVRMPGDQGRAVAIRKLKATAGSGTRNWDETVEGYLYFGEQWLRKHALDPRHCRVARAVGASMEPTLPDGCSILVDLQGKEFRDGAVIVARTSDGVVARRAAKLTDGRQLVSDDGQSAPVRWQSAGVIGEVRWVGRTL